MKVVTTTGLTELITKIKSWCRTNFLNKTDVEQTSTISIDSTPTSGSNNLVTSGGVYTGLVGKQATLVSGTNIKTVNNQSLLGSGNITIQGGGAVDSVNGQTGVVVLYAEDVGAYEKPASGIPKTDLASSVQTSLGKADTALQSHQSLSGYATEAWVTGRGYGTYSKPSGGIPDSDLAEAHYTESEVNSLLAEKVNQADYNPDAKTSAMTQSVGKDSNGKLWTMPGGSMAYSDTLPATAALNTIYSLGTQSTITTIFPNGTKVGDVISIIFYNGSTAATVTISGTLLPFSFIPTEICRSEIDAIWDGTYWSLISIEQEVVE